MWDPLGLELYIWANGKCPLGDRSGISNMCPCTVKDLDSFRSSLLSTHLSSKWDLDVIGLSTCIKRPLLTFLRLSYHQLVKWARRRRFVYICTWVGIDCIRWCPCFTSSYICMSTENLGNIYARFQQKFRIKVRIQVGIVSNWDSSAHLAISRFLVASHIPNMSIIPGNRVWWP